MRELYESDFAGVITLYNRVCDRLGSIYEGPNKCSTFNDYAQPKLTGFTQVKGRRRLTKKQRKQLRNRKK